MEAYTIENENDYEQALIKIDDLWDSKMGTQGMEDLALLIELVIKYEEKNYPID